MKQYSVLLLYPEYMASFYGETYYTFIVAEDPQAAVAMVRKRCMEDNVKEEGSLIDTPEDLDVILLTEGVNQHIESCCR